MIKVDFSVVANGRSELDSFVHLLGVIQKLGEAGTNRTINIAVDGDGSGRYTFGDAHTGRVVPSPDLDLSGSSLETIYLGERKEGVEMTKEVKVYKVTAMAQLTCHENTDEAAIRNAVERSKTEVGIWTQADAEFVAVLVENEVSRETPDRKIPQEEQDIREFLKRATSMVEAASEMGVKVTTSWLFRNLKEHGALDQDKIYSMHDALTKVCQHDKHIHDGSICWTCGDFWA